MDQKKGAECEREIKLATLANNIATELLRLKLNEKELTLFFKRLQVVDASIKYTK